MEIFLLRDRDTLSDSERQKSLSADAKHRMLLRHEVENYVLDFCVLDAYCKSNGQTIEKTAYDAIVQNINSQDIKAGSTTAQLKALCGYTKSQDDFKKALAPFMRQCASVYSELQQCIF